MADPAPRRVMIATPCHDGKITVQFADSLVGTIRAAAALGIFVTPVYMPYDALVQRARNDLARLALESQVDDVLFIDADQEWGPADAMKLLAAPVDVVGAAVRKKTDAEENYNIVSLTANPPVDAQSGLWIVDSIGAGLLRVTGAALKATWDRCEEYTNADGSRCRAVFEVQIIAGRLWSEDNVFCKNLRDAGYTIYLDPTIIVGHYGWKRFAGDVRPWMNRVRAHIEEIRSAQA